MPLAAYIVDTLEACMLAYVHGKTSPFMMVSYLEFGNNFHHPECTHSITLNQLANIQVDPNDLEGYFDACTAYYLNGVDKPFWQDWSSACPSVFLIPEALHHWHKELFDHDCQWCIVAVGVQELDFQFSILQSITGYHHYSGRISQLKQVMGRVHHNIQHYIVGLTVGAAPSSINKSLLTFHTNKDAIMTLGTQMGMKKPIDNWFFIPKLELMQSITASTCKVWALIQRSANATEHTHVSKIKDPARRTNNNDYDPQICHHLDQQKKLQQFAIAMTLKRQGR
ncbi:uncharacterized protein BJ212DRAFT_1447829 [Suillus subaureus]|uniref:Uncharacterized protein n=1 Tax=Suillus subaureus TaxID=48587 RepID=A0A9P7JC25_9AGAM|nr:uncharacterized protein BJ212DRAFT_1447829 [Suillus subaureus]KAG1813635.1 hypothetical protein BJ212DRAFT_1447829 [Suillus subaureus]